MHPTSLGGTRLSRRLGCPSRVKSAALTKHGAFPLFSDKQIFSQTVGTSHIKRPQATSRIYQLLSTLQRVGWVELSDTHQSQFANMMGFAKSSTPSYGLW